MSSLKRLTQKLSASKEKSSNHGNGLLFARFSSDSESDDGLDPLNQPSSNNRYNPRSLIYTCILILIINLLNYINRYSLTPLLIDIQAHFSVRESDMGKIPTVFICAYMVSAPMWGYLGDRHSRKYLISIGTAIWSMATIICTLIPSGQFAVFMVLIGIAGLGQASSSIIAPTLIADFFVGNERTIMLTLFYLGLPIGAGLGLLVGSGGAALFDSWEWGVRLTPCVGLCFAMLFLLIHEPVRGLAEGQTEDTAANVFRDLKDIFVTRTYLCVTFGFSAVTFATGSLVWWAPTYFIYSQAKDDKTFSKTSAGLSFGVILAGGGIIGTLMGSLLVQYWRRWNPRADLLVCGGSLLAAAPILYVALTIIGHYLCAGLTSTFLAVTLLCFNWAISPDIVFYITIPSQRALATGMFTFFGHLFGDAFSPFIVAKMAQHFRGHADDPASRYFAFRNAFYLPIFVTVYGGVLYLLGALHVIHDKRRAQQRTESHKPSEDQPIRDPAVASNRDEDPKDDLTNQQQ